MTMLEPAYVRLTPLSLADDEVHVWSMSLDQPTQAIQMFAGTLSADERARCARFHFENDQRAFVASHGLLRTILSRYLAVGPSRLRFGYGPHGKPTLVESPLRFNLSHAHQLVLIAVALNRELGADVEHVRPMGDMEQIVARFFSSSERATFRALPASQKREAFFNGWTRKEAYLKAIGDGLARPLDTFDVSLAPGAPAKLLRVAGASDEVARWSLRALAPAPGYLAALCVEGHDWQLVFQPPLQLCRVCCQQS
jgi:4'-phosphopantetheinyl transferase